MRKVLKIGLIILAVILAILAAIVILFVLQLKNIMKQGGYYEDWEDSMGRIYRDVPYGAGGSQLYDLYIPTDADPAQKQSVMLFIHGGSWSSGSRRDMDYACKRYAKAGYITATMEYSLMSAEHPEVTIPVMLDEIGNCIAALRDQVTELGFIPDKLALSGGSAGGHLALLYGYSRADTSALPIAFVFEQTGPTDFHGSTWGADDTGVAAFVSGLTGHPITVEQVTSGEAEEWINSVSPAAWVKESSVPTVMGYGGKDTVVGTNQHSVLIERLEACQVPYTYIPYPNSDHPLNSDPDSQTAYHEAVLEYAERYFGY